MVIFIYKVLKILGKIGKSLTLVITLFFISTLIISLKLSKEETVNPFCRNNYDNKEIVLNYNQIDTYTYRFDCSTMYFYIKVDENLNKEEIKSLLLSIGYDLKEYDFYTHFEVISDSLPVPLYASIDLKTQKLNMIGN